MSIEFKRTLELQLAAVIGVVSVITSLLPHNPVVIILSLALAFGLSSYLIWTFPWIEKTFFRRYASLAVVFVCLCIVGYFSWPSSEVEKISPFEMHLKLGTPIIGVSTDNPLKICKEDSKEFSGLKISVLNVKTEHETIIERILAIVSKNPFKGEPRRVVYGTLIGTFKKDSKLKKMSSIEAGTCMTYDAYSIWVTSISPDSDCAEFTVSQNINPCK
jgi:hypothetical protein